MWTLRILKEPIKYQTIGGSFHRLFGSVCHYFRWIKTKRYKTNSMKNKYRKTNPRPLLCDETFPPIYTTPYKNILIKVENRGNMGGFYLLHKGETLLVAGGGGGINTAKSSGGSGGCASTKTRLVKGIAGGGGWGIKYEDNTPNPIVEVSGGGTNIKREGYYTDNFNTYYIDSEGKKHLR